MNLSAASMALIPFLAVDVSHSAKTRLTSIGPRRPPPRPVSHAVQEDRVQPRGRPHFAVEPVPAPQGLVKGLLREVGRVVGAPRQPERRPVQPGIPLGDLSRTGGVQRFLQPLHRPRGACLTLPD